MSKQLIFCLQIFLTVTSLVGYSSQGIGGPRALSDQDILSASSTGNLTLKKAKIIIDNYASFEQKLEIVRNAKENLYLTYYIYSDDYSSSKFTLSLIEKAKSGTKIKLLVDLITNYSRMDLFRFLEAQGQGNIEVRFYNKPSVKIQQDAFYFTIPCSHENQVANDPKACETEKQKILAAGNFTAKQGLMQKLYLASLYTKNPAGLKVAVAGGQELDLTHAGQVISADKAKKADFLELKKTYEDAKAGSVLAQLNIKSMLEKLTAEIDPSLNLVNGLLPMDHIRKDHRSDWEHLSDYSHQKLILADVGNGQFNFELGGRNIEDSYHLKGEYIKQLKGDERQKYLFRDTDFYGEVASGGDEIVQAFLRVWNFKEMVATTKEMDAIAPFDLSVGAATCSATSAKDDQKFEQCMQQFFMSLQTNPEEVADNALKRVMKVAKNTMARAQDFEAKYVQPTKKAALNHLSIRGANGSDELSVLDLKSALITYVENLNMRKDSQPSQRTFGAKADQELESGKYISHLWQRGMENVCASGKKTEVILHTAYLLPSASMMKTLANMVDGTWSCQNVMIKIVTNSFKTTDLNIINIIARAEIQALFDKYIKGFTLNSATLNYYEYAALADQNQSLHTKLSVMGDDLIIGSANADIRSYYMDTNNGVYLRNVPNLASDYRKFIEGLIQNGTIVERTDMFATYESKNQTWTTKQFVPEVSQMVSDFMDYWIGRSKDPKTTKLKHAGIIEFAKHFLSDKANDAYLMSQIILNPEKFVPEKSKLIKACGSGNNNGGYSDYDSIYSKCVNGLKKSGSIEVGEKFNMTYQVL